ncbi:hypothetical protein ACPPVS_11185 [Cellulomonas sp. McL0617]|uniref:hypothetical protein n=1 Tax=Cellulomonas sp. McL0617 TaxID=3415675 RepID=UPI003CF1B1D7
MRRLIATGELPATRLGRRLVRIRAADVEALSTAAAAPNQSAPRFDVGRRVTGRSQHAWSARPSIKRAIDAAWGPRVFTERVRSSLAGRRSQVVRCVRRLRRLRRLRRDSKVIAAPGPAAAADPQGPFGDRRQHSLTAR